MRKTLVFYRGRAPHGQKTDWIMHEYRLDDAGEHQPSERIETEDGWAVCRVFQKKCFIKTSGEATSSQGSGGAPNLVGPTTFDLSRSPSLAVECLNQQHSLHLHHQTYSIAAFYKPELALNYPQLPQSTTNAYPHTQVHTLLHNYRQFSGYHGFSEQLQAVEVGGERDHLTANEWAVMDSLAGRRFAGGGAAAAAVQQMNEAAEPRVGDIGLWGYRK